MIDASLVHKRTRGYDIAFQGESFVGEDPNRLFDWMASYAEINVHHGDAAGNTLFEIEGYGLDATSNEGDYQCQFKEINNAYEQSVNAFVPSDSRHIRCVSEWWDSRAATVRVSLHKVNAYADEFVDASLVKDTTRNYDVAYSGEQVCYGGMRSTLKSVGLYCFAAIEMFFFV